MKIKRDPETLTKLRQELKAKPGLFRNVDKMSDEEMADSVDQFLDGMVALGRELRPRIREAVEAMNRAGKNLGRAATELRLAMERQT